MVKIPEWIDLPDDVKEKHLTDECGLTVHEREEMEDYYLERPPFIPGLPMTYDEVIDQFPTEDFDDDFTYHAELDYDHVLKVTEEIPALAEIKLMRLCMAANVRPVGEKFWARGYWCLRVRKVR